MAAEGLALWLACAGGVASLNEEHRPSDLSCLPLFMYIHHILLLTRHGHTAVSACAPFFPPALQPPPAPVAGLVLPAPAP